MHRSLCVASWQDLFSVFHERLKCAVSAAVAAIRRRPISHGCDVAVATATATLADGGPE